MNTDLLRALVDKWEAQAEAICERGELWSHDKTTIHTLNECAAELRKALATPDAAGPPAYVAEWHRRAVELGYDGVSELIAFALPCIVNSGGDEHPLPP